MLFRPPRLARRHVRGGQCSRVGNRGSLASTYAFGAHTVTLAYQSSTGEIGYPYGGPVP